MYLVTPVEYFQKSRVFEDACTANSQALHARLWLCLPRVTVKLKPYDTCILG